uniref:Putative HNH endonuclease n=1 Tax=viral metagenome TaxID=1070528 RepID=A0A6M3JJM6_9ZZZZ
MYSQAEYNRKWRAGNPEKAAEYAKRNRTKRKDAIVEYNREWRARNPDKVAEQAKRNRTKNKDRIVEYNKKWREEHPEAVKEWQRSYHERKRLRVNGKTISVNKRPKTIGCEMCGEIVNRLEYHHWDDEHPCLGLWLCWNCHRIAEGVDKNLHFIYLREKESMVLETLI